MHGGACAARSAAAEGVPLLIQAISHASQRELTELRESPSGSCARFNPLPPFSGLIRLSRYRQTTATLLALLIRSPIGSQACTAPPAAAAAPASALPPHSPCTAARHAAAAHVQHQRCKCVGAVAARLWTNGEVHGNRGARSAARSSHCCAAGTWGASLPTLLVLLQSCCVHRVALCRCGAVLAAIATRLNCEAALHTPHLPSPPMSASPCFLSPLTPPSNTPLLLPYSPSRKCLSLGRWQPSWRMHWPTAPTARHTSLRPAPKATAGCARCESVWL